MLHAHQPLKPDHAAVSLAQATETSAAPVLIVEDDPGMSFMLLMALEDAAYPVVLAANGVEALDQLQRVRPCLILLDLRMPIMDGPTFLHQLYAQTNATPPIIIMTAYSEVDPDIAHYGLPMITKPMQIDQLLQLIERYKA